MKSYISIFLLLSLLFFTACKTKDACQINHTGNICVTNNNDINLEVFVNGIKEFTLGKNEKKSTPKPVGNYTVIVIPEHQSPKEYSVTIKECEDSEINVNIYE